MVTKLKLLSMPVFAVLLVAVLVGKGYSFTANISTTASSSDGDVQLSTTAGILEGALGETTASPQDTVDTLTATFGIPNALLDSEFNIFNVSPAQMTEWGTAYGEVWGGAGTQWGGATIGLPVGRLGVFLGRPYGGVAASIAQPVGTVLAGTADASSLLLNTGIQTGLTGTFLGGLTNVPGAATGHALYDTRVLAPRNMIDLLFGIPLGDNLSLGIAYAYARNKDEENWSDANPTAATTNTAGDGSITNDRKTTDHQIALGVLVKNLGPIDKLDFAFNIAIPKVDNTHNETILAAAGTKTAFVSSTLESDGAKTFGFLLRTMIGMGDTSKIVTALTYNRPNTSSKGTFRVDSDGEGTFSNLAADIDRSWTIDDKATNFRLDTAWHSQPKDALKVIYSLSFVRSSSEREFTLNQNNSFVTQITGVSEKEKREETITGLPIGIAVEHQSFSKVSTRFGLRKTLFGKNKIEITDTTNRVVGAAFVLDQTARRVTEIDSSVAATATLGIGIKPTRDVSIDLAIVTNVFDLDTGAGAADVFTRASLRYHY